MISRIKLKRLAPDLYRIGTTDFYFIQNYFVDPLYPDDFPDKRGRRLWELAYLPEGETSYRMVTCRAFKTLKEAKVHYQRWGFPDV